MLSLVSARTHSHLHAHFYSTLNSNLKINSAEYLFAEVVAVPVIPQINFSWKYRRHWQTKWQVLSSPTDNDATISCIVHIFFKLLLSAFLISFSIFILMAVFSPSHDLIPMHSFPWPHVYTKSKNLYNSQYIISYLVRTHEDCNDNCPFIPCWNGNLKPEMVVGRGLSQHPGLKLDWKGRRSLRDWYEVISSWCGQAGYWIHCGHPTLALSTHLVFKRFFFK